MEASFTVTSGPDGMAYVDYRGDLDLAARAVLIECVDLLLDDNSIAGIDINMSHVDFIDSSCIGALVSGKLKASKAGKTLHVHGARGQVDEVLTMTGVAPLLSHRPPAVSDPRPE